MPGNQFSKLAYYGKFLKRKNRLRPVECPDCAIRVLPHDFEKHCVSSHGLDARLCCVWCCGDRSWPAGEKHLNADHLLDCFKNFYAEKEGGGALLKLNRYRRCVESKSKISFSCPGCSCGGHEKISNSAEFEKHCESNHGLDPKTCCVWCWGKHEWEMGTKNRHADHLIRCFQKFMVLLTTGGSSSGGGDDPRLLNTRPMCRPRDFFDHVRDVFSSESPFAFESFRVLDYRLLRDRVDYFEDDNLNAAASFVRLFVKTTTAGRRKERAAAAAAADWIHVMVKAVSVESFARSVDDFTKSGRGTLKTLPFSCWCDGGGRPGEEARFRRHRHWVVVCWPATGFEKYVWPAVKASERPSTAGVFQSKGSQRIRTPMHLINTLGYLCKRESRCNFKIDVDCGGGGSKKKLSGPAMDKHFYIFESLPVDHLLPLSVQWDGGILKMLHQIKFQNVSVLRLMNNNNNNNNRLVFREGRWKQKIKDFYGFESGWVLPLRKGCVPTKEITSSFAYLVEGRKLYFTERVCSAANELEEEEEETWLKKQVEGGNVFYESVGEEFWIPRKRDQAKLNLAMPLWERNRELESETTRLRDEVTNLKKSHEAEVTDLKKSHEEEVIDLKRKHEEEIESLMRDRRRKVNKIEYEKNVKVKLSLDP